MKHIYLLFLMSLFSLNSNPVFGQIATFNCNLETTAPTYNRIFIGFTGVTLSGAGTNVHYQLYQISPSITGSYSFPASYSGDGVMTIYTSPFDPADPVANVVAYSDDGNPNSAFDPLIITDLDEGECYTIVASTYDNGSTGAYNFEVFGPAGATLTDTGCNAFVGIQECVSEISATPPSIDISDPCACGNPLNILDATGEVTLFHEEVTITAATGQTWNLTGLNSGDALDAGGVALALPAAMTETPAGSGTYILEFWHAPATGYDGNFSNGTAADDQTVSNSCSGPCLATAAEIPTMSQWGLMILGLLFLSFSAAFTMVQQPQYAGSNYTASSSFSQQIANFPFQKLLFGKMIFVAALFFFGIFTLATAFFGYEMTTADLPGSIIATPILAYLLHLFFMKNN